jgi:DNA-binding PadR family transcriptional regulator
MPENRSAIEYCLLSALAINEGHGYDIYRELRRRLGVICRLGRSQVYGLLAKMEKDGLVDHQLVHQDSFPSKKVYRITARGWKTLEGWLSEPVGSVRDIRVDFFLKIHFARRLSSDGGNELLGLQKRVLLEKRSGISSMRESVKTTIEKEALDYRQTMVKAALNWLEEISEGDS